MARSGYESLSKELGELSLLAQSAGDMTAEMANNYLLATDAAYKYGGSVESLNAALDGANYISNKNSASLTDITDATRVSASFAANANVAIDELTAAEATMIATTKRSGSEIGRAFRSIILNLQQVSGEFDGEVIDEEQLKKVEARCHSLGVELEYMKDGVATLRNPIEVLKELSEVYNSLPDNSADKQGLISDLGGKYHANALSALLSRWDLYEKMVGEFSRGTGSALKEAQKTADSWAGRVAQLQNTWDDFINSLTDKEAIKGGVGFLDNTIQAFGKLADTLGAIPVIMTTINGSMATLNRNYGISQIFNGETRKLDIQGNFMGIDITAFKAQKKHFGEASAAMQQWNDKLLDGRADVNTFGSAVVQNNEQLKAYLATTSKDAPASLSGYKSYLNAAGVSTDALRLKTILMTSALTMGLSLGIQTIVTGISKMVNAENEAVQSAKEAADAYEKSSSSMDDYISRYSELREQLLAAKGNEEETYNVKKQLLDLQTELNEKYGEEHGYLNLVTDAYKDQTEAIKEFNKETANRFLNENEQGINAAKRKMESENTYDLSYAIAKTPDNEKFMDEIVGKYKDAGMSILDAGEAFYIKLDADPKDAYETINSFMTDVQDKAKELGNENLFKNTVSNMASDSLNKAKETLDKYQEIYKQAQMAHIASSTSLSDGYNKAISAVEAYNEAVLKSEDPYNDESVNKAWNDLQTVKQGIQENEAEWGKYSSVMDDVFSAANDDVYSFYQTLQNDSTISELAEDLKGLSDVDLQAMFNDGDNWDVFDKLAESAEEYGIEVQDLIDLLVKLGYVQGEISKEAQDIQPPSLSFQEAWASLDNITDSDSPVKDLKKDILSLAEAGQLTIEKFTETKGSDSFLEQLGIEPDDTQEINNLISKINELKSSADQLSSMKKGISGLSENLYNRQQNQGTAIDADTLAGMDSALKEQTAEWEKYVTVLGDASASMDDIQKATDELATAYVNSNNFLANLTEANKDYYVSQLDAMGVANSAEVVEERLTAQRQVAEYKVQALAAATKDLADSQEAHKQSSVDAVNATYENSKALSEQSDMTDLAKASLVELIANEQIFASTDLNLSQQITELNKLAYAYLGVSQAIAVTSAMGADPRYYTEDYIKQKTNEILGGQAKVSTSVSPRTSGNNRNSNSSSNNSKKEDTEKEFSEIFDWIERMTKRLQKAFDKWLNQAETALTSGFINKYYKKAISSAEKELSTYSNAYNRYMAQANAVGLDETYASKVRNGTIDIEEIYKKGSEEDIKKFEELAEKIKKYQDYYDKAQDSMDSFMETAEKLYNLPLDKAATKIEKFNDSISLLDKQLENATKSKDKITIIKDQTKEEKKTLNAYKEAQSSSAKSFKSASKQLKKDKNLDADDGISAKEKKKIQDAVKKNKEVDLSFFNENSAGYKAAVKYNEALKANKKAVYDAECAQQDYNSWLAEAYEKIYNLPLDKAAEKIEKYSDSISLLDKKLGNAIGSTNKNKLIDQQKKQEKNTLNAYKTAETDSKTNLNKAKKELKKNKNLGADDGITKKERNKIKDAIKKNQTVDLTFFKEGTAGYEAAVKYNKALEANKKATNDAAAAQEDYNRYLVESAKQKFDNIADDYNKKVQKKGWEMSALDNKISEIEAAGKKVDKSYYTSQKKVNNKTLDQYKAEKTALEKNLKKIKEGTDEWYDAKDQIQQVNNAISDCVKTTYELNNAINQLHFDLFDDVSDGIKRIITEQEFLQGLFAHEKNTDTETGNFTEAGIAKLGSLSASYYASKENADRDEAMLKSLQKVKSKGKQKDGTYKLGKWTFNSLDDLEKKIDETYTKWQDDIKETYSLESSIVDVMKEKYQAELDMLKELIDARKEALQSEKDLHDYQKTLNEKTKDITTLQKQMIAYSGDTSQEGMAKLQKLQKELADKEEDLRETEYDKYISDQQDMLDKLYKEYEELQSKKLDDFMGLVDEGLKTSNGNTAIIKTYLGKIAERYGYDIETDGLFDTSSGGIGENVGNTAKDIDKEKTNLSGTQDKDNKKNNTPSVLTC